MINKKLIDYIRKQKSKGISDLRIKEALVEADYSPGDIEQHFKHSSYNISKPNSRVIIISLLILIIISCILFFSLNKKPDDLSVALHFYQKGQYKECIETLEKYPEKDNPRVFRILGFCYSGIRDYDNSIFYLSEAVKLNPADSGAYNKLAGIYFENKEYNNAIETLNQLINIKQDAVAYKKLATSYLRIGNYLEAELNFNNAINLDSGNDTAYSGLGWVYFEQGKYSEAKYAFLKAIDMSNNNAGAYSGLGWVYIKEGNYDNTEPAFNHAIIIDSGNSLSYAGLGWVYHLQGREDESTAEFNKALGIDPRIAGSVKRWVDYDIVV